MMTVYTTTEVAALLHVSAAAVSAWIDEGILPGWKLPGGGRRVSREALAGFMAEHGMPPELLPPEEPVKDEEVAAP